MARTEVWVEDSVAPTGRWVWIGGYEGDGGTTVQGTAVGVSSTVGSAIGPTGAFLSLPGTTGSVAWVPSSAALNLSGAHTLRIRMRRSDWTPLTNQVVLTKWSDSDGGQSWFWRLQADGQPYFQFTTNGSADTAAPGAPAPVVPPAANEIIWVQFEVKSDRQIVLSTHPDQQAEPTTGWTAISTSATGAALGTIYASTTNMVIGSTSGFAYQPLEADIFQMCLRNESDTLVFQLDPAEWTAGSTWVTTTGQTVTLAGSATIGSEP